MKTSALALLVVAACATHHAASTRPIPPAPTGVAPGPNATMRIHLIDVGQGAATLVEFSCAAILVDTGGEQNEVFDSEHRLIAYLDRFFKHRPHLANTLALLVITHPHIDHDRSALAVFQRYHVTHLVTDGLRTSSGGVQQSQLLDAAERAGIVAEAIDAERVPADGVHDGAIDPIACPDGDPDIRALWGASDDRDNLNNDSVVVHFALGAASFLIDGDLELAGIASLLAKYGGTTALRADVWQVGHHGSWNATTAPLLAAIQPKLAIIGMGSPEREVTWSAYAYGHPRLATIELLEAALTGAKRDPHPARVATGAKQFVPRDITAPIYATGWDGDVEITLFADGRPPKVVHHRK